MQDVSGYQVFRNDRLRLLFDTAPLGPDYLPGHAHADLLAVLLDLDGEPVFTDSGVMEYSEGPARTYCRSTAAHNTVSIDGLDQAELWKSFRIGRRGKPRHRFSGVHPMRSRNETDHWKAAEVLRPAKRDLNRIFHARRTLPTSFSGGEVEQPSDRFLGQCYDWIDDAGDAAIRCAHDGFARQCRGLWHERSIHLLADGVRIVDRLSGRGRHRFTSRFHLAPGVHVEERNGCWWINGRLGLTFLGATARLETTPYYPEFGRAVPRACLTLTGDFHRRTRLELRCTFSS